MIVIDVDPVALRLGPLAIRWYGIMYAVGIVLGLRAATPYALARGLTHAQIDAVLGWGIAGGLLGGRLYFVAQQPLGPYLAEPWRVLAAWEGGMAFFGAIFGAAAALAVACRRGGVPLWTVLDAGALFATVGQFFGRIGNVVNGDVLGPPTGGAWGFVYVHPDAFAPVRGLAYHPAPLYEMAANLLILALLWWLRGRLPRPGLLFAVYLAAYALSQFVVFFWRSNEAVALGLAQAQLTAAVVFAGALALVAWLTRHTRRGYT